MSEAVKNNISIRRVHKDLTELGQIINVYNKAFDGHIFIASMVGGFDGHHKHPNIAEEQHRAFIMAGLVGGKVYVAEIPKVGIVGAAIWFGPGEKCLGSEEQLDAGYRAFREKLYDLDPDMKTWRNNYLAFHPTLQAPFLPDETARLNSWYLCYFSTLPEYQGKGVRRALLKESDERARALAQSTPDEKQEEVILWLETETLEALNFYKACGYEVAVESEFPSPASLGSYKIPIWSLKKSLKVNN